MENCLHIIVPKKNIEQVISRASLAASTDEGKSNVSKIGNEALGCVKISTSGENIVFESSVSRFSARLVVPPSEGMSIVSPGAVCIPLKEFKQTVAKISDSYGVSILFSPIPATKMTEVPANMRSMLPVGTVDIGAINSKKKIFAKATMDAFPTSNFNAHAFPEISELDVVFTGQASCLRKPYSDNSFSANPDDPNEIFNKLAIFMNREGIYFLAADGRRCAIVKSASDQFDTYACVDENLPILIEIEYLTQVLSSLSDSDPITLAVSRDRSHSYILSDRTSYRIAMVGEQTRTNYPAIRKIIDMEAGASVLIDRKELLIASNMLYNVCNDRGTHSYRDNEIVLSSQSLMVLKRAEGLVDFTWASEARLKKTEFCFNTGNLVDGLNRMSGEQVKLTFTPDERKVKIEDASDPDMSYYLQVIPPSTSKLIV